MPVTDNNMPASFSVNRKDKDELTIQVTEISCVTNWEFHSIHFNWRVNNFSSFRQMAEEGLLPDSGVISSPKYADPTGSEWWLNLYPYEARRGRRGQVSLFIHTDRPKKGDVHFAFQVSALDSDGVEVAETKGGSNFHKFTKSAKPRNYGFYDFLKGEDIIQACVDANDSVTIKCAIRVFTAPQTTVVEE